MQQIGKELRGQTAIDPLDTALRARILATVREMTPQPTAPVHSWRPALAWGGGAAVAALLLTAVFASHSRFAVDYQNTGADMAGSTGSSAPSSLANSQKTGAESASGSPTFASKAPAQSRAGMQSQVRKPTVSEPAKPQLEAPQAASGAGTADKSLSQREGFVSPVPQSAGAAGSFAGNGIRGQAKNITSAPGSPSEQPSDAQSLSRNTFGLYSKRRRVAAVVSPLQPSIHGESLSVAGRSKPKQPVALDRAGFDLDGYQFVAAGGQRITVPFKKSLNAVRFARAADGRMELAESLSPPILYLAPADTLVNDAVPGSRWQPLPPGFTSLQPLYVRSAPDWEQFIAMRWYPNMTVVGGLANLDSADAAFTLLSGSHVQIGTTLCPDFAAYRAFADSHPDAMRLHTVYSSAYAPVPPAAPAPDAAKASRSARDKPHP